MANLKKASEAILKRISDAETAIFETSKGLRAGEAVPPRKAIRELRGMGVEALPVAGSYKGQKNLSIAVPGYSDPRVQDIVHNYLQKTGQESALVTKPGGGARLVGAGGEHMADLPGQSISGAAPSGDAYSKLQTPQGPRYVEYGTGNAQATHYSDKPGLAELDPAMAGTGADASRAARQGPRSTPSVYGYGGIDATPEALLQGKSNKYLFNYAPERTYDFAKDPQGFMKRAQADLAAGRGGNAADQNDLARAYAKQAGFEGATWPMQGDEKMPIVERFSKTPVVSSLAEQSPRVADTVQDWLKQKAIGAMRSQAGQAVMGGLEQLGKPQAGLFAGTSEALKGKSLAEIISAAKQGFQKPETAPSGHQLAEQAGEKYGVTNPYVLTAAGTAADWFADPSNLVAPGLSKVGKLAKLGLKEARVASKGSGEFGKIIQTLAKKAPEGKIIQTLAKKAPEGKIIKTLQKEPAAGKIIRTLQDKAPEGKILSTTPSAQPLTSARERFIAKATGPGGAIVPVNRRQEVAAALQRWKARQIASKVPK